jgi:hypothetical protein
MTADGPRIIDWVATVRAQAALDLARCHVTLSELVYAPEGTDLERPRALNAAVQSEYARLAGMSPRGADGGDGALPVHPPRLRPRRAGDQPCPTGAADPAHRSDPALGGPKRNALCASA